VSAYDPILMSQEDPSHVDTVQFWKNIKTDLTVTGYGCMDWLFLARFNEGYSFGML
jgi:hypothetical protein